jgi:hypothetical protein
LPLRGTRKSFETLVLGIYAHIIKLEGNSAGVCFAPLSALNILLKGHHAIPLIPDPPPYLLRGKEMPAVREPTGWNPVISVRTAYGLPL